MSRAPADPRITSTVAFEAGIPAGVFCGSVPPGRAASFHITPVAAALPSGGSQTAEFVPTDRLLLPESTPDACAAQRAADDHILCAATHAPRVSGPDRLDVVGDPSSPEQL